MEFYLDSYHATLTGKNILADITGRELPTHIAAFGGHIDSWDVGTGAVDDGGGVFSTWEAVKILNDMIMAGELERPRRSIRSIGWFNEENGSDGANLYFEKHKDIETHVLVGESDEGNFKPINFGYTGTDEGYALFQSIVGLLHDLNITSSNNDGETTDNEMWCAAGYPCASLESTGDSSGDQTYFWFHHSDADTPDKLVESGLKLSAAAIAVVLYVAADIPESLSSQKTVIVEQ